VCAALSGAALLALPTRVLLPVPVSDSLSAVHTPQPIQFTSRVLTLLLTRSHNCNQTAPGAPQKCIKTHKTHAFPLSASKPNCYPQCIETKLGLTTHAGASKQPRPLLHARILEKHPHCQCASVVLRHVISQLVPITHKVIQSP
jgi:hypothetical protein